MGTGCLDGGSDQALVFTSDQEHRLLADYGLAPIV